MVERIHHIRQAYNAPANNLLKVNQHDLTLPVLHSSTIAPPIITRKKCIIGIELSFLGR